MVGVGSGSSENGENVGWIVLTLLGHIFPDISSVALFDPFDGLIQTLSQGDLEPQVADILNVSLRWVVIGIFILENMGGKAVNLVTEGIIDQLVLAFSLTQCVGEHLADHVESEHVNALMPVKHGVDHLGGHSVSGPDGVRVDECQAGHSAANTDGW